MGLKRQERRNILAMCCEVARADGTVSTLEFEHLVELLSRIAQGVVGLDELQRWLEKGAPISSAKIPEDHLKLFLREAIGVAASDGHVDDSEITTIKALVARCFEGSEKYR